MNGAHEAVPRGAGVVQILGFVASTAPHYPPCLGAISCPVRGPPSPREYPVTDVNLHSRRTLTLILPLTASETIFLSWGQGSAQVSHSTHAFQIWRHLWPWGEVVGKGEEEEVSFPLEMTPVILNYSSHSTCFCISFGGKKGQSPWMQLPCLIFPVSLQPLPRVCWVQVAWCWSG